MQIFPSLESFWRNVRYSARQLRRNPLFTTIAVLSLALGIGANTAVFTLLDQLVLRLLPVEAPERFAGDPNVVGKKILVNNYPMEIVGVAAAGFTGLDPSQSPHIWAPIQMKPLLTPGSDNLGNRRSQSIQMFGRLKPGYTVKSAGVSLQPLFHQILEQEAREPRVSKMSSYYRAGFLKRTAIVETAANGYSDMRQQYSTALIVLMGMAGLILLIACSNVAGLLVARAIARQKEIAVRPAIGAADFDWPVVGREHAGKRGGRPFSVTRSHPRTTEHAAK